MAKMQMKSQLVEVAKCTRKASFMIYGFGIFSKLSSSSSIRGIPPPKVTLKKHPPSKKIE